MCHLSRLVVSLVGACACVLSAVEIDDFAAELRAAEVALSSATLTVLSDTTGLGSSGPSMVVVPPPIGTVPHDAASDGAPAAIPGAIPRTSLTGPLPPINGRYRR